MHNCDVRDAEVCVSQVTQTHGFNSCKDYSLCEVRLQDCISGTSFFRIHATVPISWVVVNCCSTSIVLCTDRKRPSPCPKTGIKFQANAIVSRWFIAGASLCSDRNAAAVILDSSPVRMSGGSTDREVGIDDSSTWKYLWRFKKWTTVFIIFAMLHSRIAVLDKQMWKRFRE